MAIRHNQRKWLFHTASILRKTAIHARRLSRIRGNYAIIFARQKFVKHVHDKFMQRFVAITLIL